MHILYKAQNEIIRNGVVYKHAHTEASLNKGYHTDYFVNENGEMISAERPKVSFRTKAGQKDGAYYIESFKGSFARLISGIESKVSEEELNNLILQCNHPLTKAKEWFEKKETLDFFYNEVNSKLAEFIQNLEGVVAISYLEKISNSEKIKENSTLNNAVQLQLYKLKNPEVEKEEEKDINI